MKVYLDTIGCKLNQAEIENFARQFRAAGHILVPVPEEADLAVVNTCLVTGAAESDSRQKVRQITHAGVNKVVVTGCWATLRPEEAASLPGVNSVVPNAQKDRLVIDLLGSNLPIFDQEPVERLLIPGARSRTRAFIKVQDGCDNHCTFCITAAARGLGRSRTSAEILADIQAVLREDSTGAGNAARELVLTGVHLGSWGQDFSPRLHLQDLIQAILDQPTIPRLRLSSLEPWDLAEAFFTLWQDPRLCRHLHLPLQSGSQATLRRMARKTTPKSFADLAGAARRQIPGVAVTTDIITGFPGETEAEFAESLAFVQAMDFAGGHVFTYSPRPGTAAARLPNQVPPAIRKKRSGQMRAVLEESSQAYRLSFLGQVVPVLWESVSDTGNGGWHLEGLTDNYLRVSTCLQVENASALWNQISQVHLDGLTPEGVRGTL